MEVYKFGGASIKDAEAVRNLERIVAACEADNLVLVVSAMGKTTNALEKVVDAHYHGSDDAFVLLQIIKDQHKLMARNLVLKKLLEAGIIDDLFVEAEWLLEDTVQDEFDYLYDQIVVIGELLSTRIIAAYLELKGHPVVWLDARDFIKTDDTYRNAILNVDQTGIRIDQLVRPPLKAGKIVITQGFIGSTAELNSSTLGREGSDYTGAILAAQLEASSLTVWKDVPGIMNGDPHLGHATQLLPQLDYREALEMTYYGAKVIHPKTLKPLMDRSIPLYVRSFENPEQEGTTVFSYQTIKYPAIRVVMDQQTLLILSTLDFSFVVENHLSEVFSKAVNHKIRINLVKNLALSLSLVVGRDFEHLEAFIEDLKNSFQVERIDDVQLFTIRHFTVPELVSAKHARKIYIEEYDTRIAQLVLGRSE